MSHSEPTADEHRKPTLNNVPALQRRVFWLSVSVSVLVCALIGVLVASVLHRSPALNDDLGPDDCIRASSAILYCTYDYEAQAVRARVERVLMLRADTTLYRAVGDYLHEMPREPGAIYGQGEIAFFSGSPAKFRQSYSVNQGRIGGFGDMPLELFLAKVASANQRMREDAAEQ